MGLGLAISRMIIDYHGGKLIAASDSKYGGASFHLANCRSPLRTGVHSGLEIEDEIREARQIAKAVHHQLPRLGGISERVSVFWSPIDQTGVHGNPLARTSF
jgi:hypothetical protein